MADNSDLKLAFDALNAKQTTYKLLFEYADGNQPLRYSTDRLKEAFRNINVRFVQNWCSVVLDSVLDRLVIKGWDLEDETNNSLLDQIWTSEHIELDAHQTHRGALITSESFVIVWKDEDGGLEFYYNDPRMVHVFYDPARPKRKRFAAKWWVGDDKHYRMTLYYPDHLEYYIAKSKNTPSSYSAFVPDDPDRADNPYGAVPVFHFRCDGELNNIITLQDAINKLFADMMVSAEFGAFPQRWIISQSDTSALKNGANEIWEIPAGDGVGQDASVGQFEPTQLGNYLESIDKLANTIGIITRTPKHYFMSSGANISGEALLAMEAPLIKKVEQRQEQFSTTWQEIGAFILKLQGKEVKTSDVITVWDAPSSVQPLTEAQARQTSVNTGIPLLTQLRREGWGTDEIEQLVEDKQKERELNTSLGRELLDKLRTESAQENQED